MNTRGFQQMIGAGALGAGVGGLFAKNPYNAASNTIGQIPSTITPYFQPYQEAGTNSLNTLQGQYSNLLNNYGPLQDQYNQLMNNPGDTWNSMASGYQQSPGYQWQYNQGMNAATNSAASGGLAGSPANQQQAATMAEGLANQDFYNYMSHIMGLYNKGLQGNQGFYNQGLEGTQGLNKMGYEANSEMARMMSNYLATQAQMQMASQAAKNQSMGSSLGDLAMGTMALFGL